MGDFLRDFISSLQAPDGQGDPEVQAPDDPGAQDPPQNVDDQTGGNLISATLENDEIIGEILLTVDDLIASKTILSQKLVTGGEKVPIALQTDNFGVGKIEWLTQRTDSPTTIKRNIVDNVHDGDNIHLFFQ